ncbi:MAG: hypothetical protein GY723_22070 [bacterium]|nr:hypothetical protein [bacterium]
MQPQDDSRIRARNRVIGVVLVLVVGALLALWNRDRLSEWMGGGSPGESARETVAGEPAPPGEIPDLDQPEDTRSAPALVSEADRRWAELIGAAPQWPEDLSNPDCEQVAVAMESICATLDTRPYLHASLPDGGACDLFREAAARLAARPPRSSAEMRDFDALLGNVFHLFRALGKERTQLFVSILQQEGAQVEALALAAYQWAITRQSCEGGPDALTPEVMTDYAGFLFNTMGGQAYLRRRMPQVEALTCFYGLELLDTAAREGRSRQGIDPRPEIPRCRALLASSPLLFSDRYTARLDEMALRWERR